MPDAGLPSPAQWAKQDIASAAAALDHGIAARRAGCREEAANWFRRALEIEPTQQQSRIELATTLRELGQAEEAEPLYRGLLAEDPQSWPAMVGLGLCARQRRDLASSVEHLAAAFALAPHEPSVRLEYATTLREQERADEAEPLYRGLLAEDPRSWPAMVGLGLCARLRGDLAATAEHLAAALALAPGERSVRLECANNLREQGRTDEAETAYRALLADEPGLWQAMAGLGLCARMRRDLAAAAEHLAAALAAAPRMQWVRLEYATTLREQERADEAEPLYRGLLAEDPQSWPAMVGLGLCARLRGDLAATAEHLAAALALAPGERSVRLECANNLREQGRTDEAETAYRALLADEPGLWQAMMGLGLCARMRNDRTASVAHFMAAAKVAPDAEDACYELASDYREAGRFNEARAILRSLIDRGRAGARIWFGLGHIERWAGDRAAALEAFREGYARRPTWHELMIEMAIDEQALGHAVEAERWLLRASETEAVASTALIHLGDLARGRQQKEEALALFRQAADLPSAPVGAHVSMAQTLADLGRLDEAFRELDAAEQRIGHRPEIALTRASLLRRAGQRDEALAVVREAVAAMPAHLPLWFEWFQNERLSGDFAGIDRCLAAAPSGTVHDRAQVHYARGLAAEQRWDLDAAAAELRAVVALNPALSEAYEVLARVNLLRFDIPAAREQLRIMRGLRAADQRRQGLSPHLAHTHIGNLFDEFVIDHAALCALEEAQAMAPAERVERLLALMRANPDHTPTAIALLVALRQAGGFARTRAEDGSPGISATIMQYWDEPTPPADLLALMQTWQERNPAYRYVRFDHATALDFLRAHCPPEVGHAYLRAREPAMKADLFRLAYLFAEGGCYADADDRCLCPLGELLPPWARFVAYQEHFGTLGNNFLAAAPHHPVLGLALQLAVRAVNRGDDDMMWLSTGPGLMTRAFALTLAASPLLPAAWLERTRILSRHELERIVATHCDLRYKDSPRHWLRATFGQPKPPVRAVPVEA